MTFTELLLIARFEGDVIRMVQDGSFEVQDKDQETDPETVHVSRFVEKVSRREGIGQKTARSLTHLTTPLTPLAPHSTHPTPLTPLAPFRFTQKSHQTASPAAAAGAQLADDANCEDLFGTQLGVAEDSFSKGKGKGHSCFEKKRDSNHTSLGKNISQR